MQGKGILFSLAITAGLAGCAESPNEPGEPGEPNEAVCRGYSQAELLQLVNEARGVDRSCGGVSYSRTTALAWNDRLAIAAHSHATDMATNDFFDHTGSDGLSVSDRAQNAGYNRRSVGENIGAGYRSASAAMAGWLNSPGHCRNIMNPDYQDFAMACAEDENSTYEIYWVQVFGRQ